MVSINSSGARARSWSGWTRAPCKLHAYMQYMQGTSAGSFPGAVPSLYKFGSSWKGEVREPSSPWRPQLELGTI